jgi:hypothetical protein
MTEIRLAPGKSRDHAAEDRARLRDLLAGLVRAAQRIEPDDAVEVLEENLRAVHAAVWHARARVAAIRHGGR